MFLKDQECTSVMLHCSAVYETSVILGFVNAPYSAELMQETSAYHGGE